MGGGHLSRPDFGMPQPDPAHPLTEFYLLLQHTLDRAGVFALPALYAGFQAPARRIYPDEAADYLTLSETEQEGMTRLLAPSRLQLLPPFLWEEPLPPVPDTPSALTLTLTPQDVEAIDADPAALGRRLAETIRGKRWLRHPKAETYLAGRVALFQRVYRKS